MSSVMYLCPVIAKLHKNPSRNHNNWKINELIITKRCAFIIEKLHDPTNEVVTQFFGPTENLDIQFLSR